MDFATIIYMFVSIHVFNSFLLYFLYRAYPDVPGTRLWCAAGMMHGIGGVLTVLRGVVPDLFSISIANSLFFFGYSFYLWGIKLNSKKEGGVNVLIASALFSIPFFVLTDGKFLSDRILLSSIFLLILNFMIVKFCFMDFREATAKRFIMVFSFSILFPSLIYRIFVYLTYEVNETHFIETAQVANKIVLYSGGLQSCSILMGLVLLISLRLQDQLISNVEMLNAQAEDKSRFLAMLTHEVKTPLSVISTVLTNNKIGKNLKKIAIDSVDEIDQVINASNSALKIEGGNIDVNPECFDIYDLIEQNCHRYAGDSTFDINGQKGCGIFNDRFLVNVILNNVIQNAFKYSDSRYPVEIDVWQNRDGEFVSVEVKNVPHKNAWPDPQRIFKKYYREASSKNKSGSGLGLYIVKGFIDLIGGSVECRRDNQRVSFLLKFPSKIKK